MSRLGKVLGAARDLSRKLGVVRAAEITQLDVIGVPVFSVARPTSLTLTVHTGKGMTREEAEISGLLEAVEYGCAERADMDGLLSLSPRDAYLRFGVSAGEYVRKPGRGIGAHDAMSWVMVSNVADGRQVPAPAEVVYMPCPATVGTGAIASTSVGMACGTSMEGAVLHGLCEVVERHLNSFDRFSPASMVINKRALTGQGAELRDRVEAAGLAMALRGQRRFGLYYVDAIVYDPSHRDLQSITGGICCKTSFEDAAKGAILEAIQSRLTLIHGGRDDLDQREAWIGSMNARERCEKAERTIAAYLDGCRWESLDREQACVSSETTQQALDRVLGEVCAEFEHVLVHDFHAPSQEIKVVRVIVPGMEQYMGINKVMGRRLVEFLESRSVAA